MARRYQIFASLLFVLLLTTHITSAQYQLNYTFFSADSETDIQYSSFEGQPILVDAFATWCEPCRTEILHIKEVNKEVGDEVKVLTISVTTEGQPQDDITGVREFRDEFEADWEFGIDTDRVFTDIFNVVTLPSLLLFDGNGELVRFWEGITPVSQIYNELENKFGIIGEIDPDADSDSELVLDRLLNNLAFQITLGMTGLLTLLIILSNIINRKSEIELDE